jgi:hypothetical protein
MTAGNLDRINAVTSPTTGANYAAPLPRLPGNLADPRVLVDVLHRVGLRAPTHVTAATSLRASGLRYAVAEVDAALSASGLSTQDRMRLKTAMGHAGIF